MEIYLNGELAEPAAGARVVLTRQANDITKPDNIQADYSNTVTFPKTRNNRRLLGFSEEIDSNTLVPYRYQEAQLLSGGIEVLPYGKFELKESQEAYEGTLFSGNIRFFDALGTRKLADMDLSEFNHPWNLANIIPNLHNTENFFYPLLDIGMNLNPASVMSKHIYPAVYAKMIWQRIFQEAGFTYAAEEPEMFAREFMPTASVPRFSKEYTQARSYYGYVPAASIDNGAKSTGRNPIDRPIPYINTDTIPFYDSETGNYDKGTFTYAADAAAYVDITAATYANLHVSMGTASARLYVLHNGVEIGYHYVRSTDVESNFGNEINLSVKLENILLQPGDTLQARITLKGETAIHRWGYQLYYYGSFQGSITDTQKTGTSLQITVKDTFPEGGTVDLTNWLPDMSQKDFVKAMVKLHGWTMQTDPYENHIRLTLFNAVLRNRAIAKDWTSKRDFSQLPALSYTFGDFGRRNLFAWKEDDTVKPGYGDGVLRVDNETLPPEHDALAMPFAASESRNGFPVVPVWEEKGEGEYGSQKIQPRLLLRRPVKTAFTLTEGETVQEAETWQAYFADASQTFDLDMQRTVIPFFYDTLLAVLNKCKHVQAYYRLTPEDMQEFDQSVPVWDANFGQYFYLNIIEQYEEGKPTLVHLYRLGEPVNQNITE